MTRKNDYIKSVDRIIGKKICSLRLCKGLSRKQLSEVIDVTHQQLQKYEKGTNRISIGRLALIAKALDQNLEYFYADLENDKEPNLTHHQRMCMEVSRNFMKISSKEHQSAVNTLIKSLVKEPA